MKNSSDLEPADYVPPSILASFPAKTVFAQAAGSGIHTNSKGSNDDWLWILLGGTAAGGAAYEYH